MIKRAAATKMAQSQEKMQAYVTMTEFHYSQLCIKHEPASLIPIGVDYNGETNKLEEMADIYFPEGEDDFDKIYVLPKENLYISPIIDGIFTVHPEFKIEIFSQGNDEEDEKEDENTERMGGGFAHKENTEEVVTKNEEEMEDDEKYYFIRLTMPPVNKKRRDFCHEQVKMIFDYTKVKLDKERIVMKANVAPKTIGYTDKELKEVDAKMDEIYNDCLKQAEDLRKDKDDEIEMAYNKYVEMYGEDGDESEAVSAEGSTSQQDSTPEDSASQSAFIFGSNSQPEDDGGDNEASQSMKL